jgi:hypothetical protein
MGELLEGLIGGMADFASQAGEVMSSLNEAGENLKDLGPVAEFVLAAFEKTGAQCQQIKADWEAIQNDVLEIAAAFISQVEPVVDKILKKMHGDLKDVGPALAEAIKQGKLEELLGHAFESAVERLGNMLFNSHFWIGLGEMVAGAFEMEKGAITKIFLNIGIILKSVLDKTFQDIYQGMGKIPGLGKALGLSDYHAESFSKIYEGNLADNAIENQSFDKFIAGGKDLFTQGMHEFGTAINESKTGTAQGTPHSSVPSPVSKNSSAKSGSNEHSRATENMDKLDQSSFKPEFTSLEKMGFIMSGSKVQNPYDQRKIDLLQQIAENTRPFSHASPVTMPDNRQLRDPIDPSSYISNIV